MRLQLGYSCIESLQCEATQVADDKQGVFVDRIGMEQIVLHAADDPAERRNVQPEYTVRFMRRNSCVTPSGA